MTRLKSGDPAPPFSAQDADGSEWSLEKLRGQKVVMYFYPIDDTPGCTAEACDFRDAHDDFSLAGYVVLGVSPQGAASHRTFAEKHSLNFPLLVDEDSRLADAYGTKEEPTEERPAYTRRSTFVIDENGRIEQALYGVKARGHIASLKETLAV